MTIIFILSALETFALGVYLVSIKSQEANTVFMNLSFSRLVISAAVFLASFCLPCTGNLDTAKPEQGQGAFLLVFRQREKVVRGLCP